MYSVIKCQIKLVVKISVVPVCSTIYVYDVNKLKAKGKYEQSDITK